MWLEGFKTALTGINPLMLLLGTAIGLAVGILPVVGPSFGVTLALAFTYTLDPAAALIFLTAIQSACAYGDSIASILLNVPGGPGTVATCWEGYPMTRQGRAGTALGVATASSFVGGVLGWLSFVLLTKPMTAFALMIGAPEYFVLGIMALAMVSIASKGETIKGMVMACIGLLVAAIGIDPVTAMNYRFNFGLQPLEAGVEITLGALAIFAIPQIVEMLEEGGTIAQITEIKDSVVGGVIAAFRRPVTLLRSGTMGWLIGVLPALGTSAAGITAYFTEKKLSRHPDEFGKGSIDGLAAAETGKGACVLGDGITSLMLGVPGSVTWAILMAALIIHGVQPGPRLMTSGVLPYTIFAGLLLGQLAYFLLGIGMVKYLARLVYIPNQLLAPAVAVLCFLGAYVAKNYVYDIWIMVGLGIFAFAAQRANYPTVPMILGFILGELIEGNFHRALGVGFGSPLVFLQRPISLTLVIITLIFAAWPWISDLIKRRRKVLPVAPAVDADSPCADPEPAKKTATGQLPMLELVFAGAIGLLLVLFLVTSFQYRADVRLFPMVVSVAGLAFLVAWTIGAVRGATIRPLDMSWLTRRCTGLLCVNTLALLAAYAVLVVAIGFVAASVIFYVAVAVLGGYRKWRVLALSAAGVLVFLMIFPELLRVSFPPGWVVSRVLGLL